jgi:serine/threonine protein kinase
MEDRYEIRGKIGQGGIGSVHRAYDHRMKREVAIKRILTSTEDIHLESEATKQLMTEVSALASLQHPHIVTVFDVGSDEKGPYIVMEMINGKTLDEIVEHAPLVWHDFKVLAMQTLEALIAAQELDMIHSDLKPPNIMLTWLPSGAFQVKIVDFGLAVLIQNQSQEEIEKMEAVYGSIFFMPPEQYERKTLDTRSDLYSLGCCFYQALSGTYPFNGTTGMEVMQAHLNHTVTPIQEIRSDIPLWACNWVMWLINRYPDDRPPSAREALANFLQNDKETSPIMSRGGASGKHPRFIIPDPSTSPLTGLIPTLRDTSIVHTSAVLTASHALGTVGEMSPGDIPEDPDALAKQKRSKKLLKIAIAAAAAILLAASVWVVMKKYKGMQQEQAYNHIAAMATRNDVKQVQISELQLRIVLDIISNSKADAYLAPAYAILAKAKASDGTNFDTVITDFATNAKMATGIRQRLFEQVIEKRGSAAAVPSLIDFSAKAKDPNEAAAALNSIRRLIREEHAQGLLDVITSTEHQKVRQAAETEMAKIIDSSQNRNDLTSLISGASGNTDKPSARQALDRLLVRSKPQTQAPPKP